MIAAMLPMLDMPPCSAPWCEASVIRDRRAFHRREDQPLQRAEDDDHEDHPALRHENISEEGNASRDHADHHRARLAEAGDGAAGNEDLGQRHGEAGGGERPAGHRRVPMQREPGPEGPGRRIDRVADLPEQGGEQQGGGAAGVKQGPERNRRYWASRSLKGRRRSGGSVSGSQKAIHKAFRPAMDAAAMNGARVPRPASQPADRRSEDEAEAEGGAHQAEGRAALFGGVTSARTALAGE